MRSVFLELFGDQSDFNIVNNCFSFIIFDDLDIIRI